jgi:hypothetical protein
MNQILEKLFLGRYKRVTFDLKNKKNVGFA